MSRPVTWRGVLLSEDESAGSAFSRTGRLLLTQFRENQPGVTAGNDPEYLHQMRVTVRRLRAVLSLYSPLLGKRERQAAVRDVKWLADALGLARDSDVFVSEIWPPLRAVLGEGPLTDVLTAEWLMQQHRNARVARRALASRRCQRLIDRLGRCFAPRSLRAGADLNHAASWDQPARRLVRRQLKQYADALRGRGRRLDELDDDSLHRLRIRIKKLRYAIDAVSTLFDQAMVTTMRHTLSRLQDALGAINDLAVAERKISAVLTNKRCIDIAQLLEQFSVWRTLRSISLKRRLQTAWHDYRECRHASPFG